MEADLVAFILADASITAEIQRRLTPGILPQNSPVPAITYKRVSTPDEKTHDGGAMSGPRMQFSVWDGDYTQAKRVARLLKDRLKNHKGITGETNFKRISFEDENDGYEPTRKLHKISQDYYVYFEE